MNTTSSSSNYPYFALFEPVFAFYGGTLFAAVGWLGAVLGENTVLAYDLLTIGFISAAYGGFYWIGRQVGLRRAASHVAPICYVTGSYYATDLYGRNDWAEFAASSTIVLAVAAGAAVYRSPRPRAIYYVVAFVATVFATGSHNVSLLLDVVVLALLLAIALFVEFARRGAAALSVRRLLRLLFPVAGGLLANGWYLVPDMLYGSRTQIAQQLNLSATVFDTVGNLLDPLRSVPAGSSTPGLYDQLPVWIFGWTILAGCLALAVCRNGQGGGRRALVPIGITLAVVLYGLFRPAVLAELPSKFQAIQFPFRLTAYADALIAGLAIAVLRLLTSDQAQDWLGRRRSVRAFGLTTLGLTVGVSIGLQAWQIWIPDVQPHNGNATLDKLDANRTVGLSDIHTLPASWYADIDYSDISAPSVIGPASRHINFSASDVNAGGTGLTETITPPPGFSPSVTNVTAGPYLVSFTGLKVVGQDGGHVTVERVGKASGPVRVTISTANSAGVDLGRLCSGFALIAALGAAGATILRRWRFRARKDAGGPAQGTFGVAEPRNDAPALRAEV
jgi:hypothetical protein